MKEWLKKYWVGILCIIFGVLVLLSGLHIRKIKQENTPYQQELLNKIDSLEHQIQLLEFENDSIYIEIDTVYQQIEKIKVIRNEKLISVVYNDADSDYEFFTNYINSNRNRLDSCINK